MPWFGSVCTISRLVRFNKDLHKYGLLCLEEEMTEYNVLDLWHDVLLFPDSDEPPLLVLVFFVYVYLYVYYGDMAMTMTGETTGPGPVLIIYCIKST